MVQVEDVLEELNLSALTGEQPALPGLLSVDTEEEAQVLRSLELEPQHVDELSRRTVLPITTVMSTLTVLEMKGLARLVGRMHYIRVREAPAEYSVST